MTHFEDWRSSSPRYGSRQETMALILDGLLRPVRRERKDCCAHSVSPGSHLIEPREPQEPSWYGNEEKRDPVQLEHLALPAWTIRQRELHRQSGSLSLSDLIQRLMVCFSRKGGAGARKLPTTKDPKGPRLNQTRDFPAEPNVSLDPWRNCVIAL